MMALTFKKFEALLPDYINGHLNAALHSEIESALVKNPEWRIALRKIEITQSELRGIQIDTAKAERLERIRQKSRRHYQQGNRSRNSRPWIRRHIWAIGLGLCLILLIFGYQSQRSAPDFHTDIHSKIALFDEVKTPNIQVVLETDNPKIAIYWSFESETQPEKRIP